MKSDSSGPTKVGAEQIYGGFFSFQSKTDKRLFPFHLKKVLWAAKKIFHSQNSMNTAINLESISQSDMLDVVF